MHSWIDRRNCLSLVPKNISCWALTMQRTRVIQFYEDTFVLCLFARKRPSCRYEENTTDFVLPYPMSLSRVLCGYVRPPTSDKSVTVQMSFPELLLGQRAWCGPQDSDFSTGDYYAHENPMVYTRLLLPQIKCHSGPELCFLAMFGGRGAKTLSRGQEPQGLKVLWSSGSCHLLCTGRGDTATGLANSTTLSSPLLVAYEGTAHGPLPLLSVFSALSPFNALQLSPMSDRDSASALSPAKARTYQEPG